jgi:16S rRNA (adenine1518-N6/adenine1519-N6)-dimethyltransferase
VNSAVIALSPKHQAESVSFADLEAVVAKAFAMRRKTLANNFKGILQASDWEQLGISPQMRAQDVSIEGFVSLAGYYARLKEEG